MLSYLNTYLFHCFYILKLILGDIYAVIVGWP